MKHLAAVFWVALLSTVLLMGLASADIVYDTSLTHFQQKTNSPCVIGDPSCKQPSGMDYTKHTGPGNYDLFSPKYLATNPFSTFSGNLLPTTFAIGVDDNYAPGHGDELLVYFKTYDCGVNVGDPCGVNNLDTHNSYIPQTPSDMSFNPGNGYSDFGLTGFNLIAGHYYKFEVSVSNASAGMEQFFVITTPEPSSLLVFGSAIGWLGFALRRYL